MPKAKGVGGKRHRRGKKNAAADGAVKRVDMPEGKDQKYAKVISMMGDRRIQIETTEGTTLIGHIPGKFRKRVWINKGDIVLVSLRAFESQSKDKEQRADVLAKYRKDEVRFLIKTKQITSTFADLGAEDAEDVNVQWAEAKKAAQKKSKGDYMAGIDLPPMSSSEDDEGNPKSEDSDGWDDGFEEL